MRKPSDKLSHGTTVYTFKKVGTGLLVRRFYLLNFLA